MISTINIPTGWSIYKKVRLSIQNSAAAAFTGVRRMEGYCRQRAAPPAVLPINSLMGKKWGVIENIWDRSFMPPTSNSTHLLIDINSSVLCRFLTSVLCHLVWASGDRCLNLDKICRFYGRGWVKQRTAEYRISNRRITKDGIALRGVGAVASTSRRLRSVCWINKNR